MSVDGATGPHGRDDDVVVRKADRGWVVGGENVSDLTSAIVLADLFAADLAASGDTAVLEAVDRNDGSQPERPAPRRPTDRGRTRRGRTRRGSETGSTARQAGMRRGPREATERKPTRRHASR